MPYNNEQFGDQAKALTKSLYNQDYKDGLAPTPPGEFFLVDEVENFIVDELGNFIVGVV